MATEKIIEFIGSDEYLKITEEIGNFLKINWEDEKMPKIINLTEDILRYNQTGETQVKELIKKWLNFLNEEEINNLYEFLNENFLPKVRELWQEEPIEEIKTEEEETFEEKEKRYFELMKTIIKYPQTKKEEKEVKKEEGEEKEVKEEGREEKEEVEEFKTITFGPKEEHKKEEILLEELPQGTIIITKKKKEEEKPKGEKDFLDLSEL